MPDSRFKGMAESICAKTEAMGHDVSPWKRELLEYCEMLLRHVERADLETLREVAVLRRFLGLRFEGEFDKSKAYGKGNIVSQGNSFYIAIADVPGSSIGNASHWQAINDLPPLPDWYSDAEMTPPPLAGKSGSRGVRKVSKVTKRADDGGILEIVSVERPIEEGTDDDA